MSGLQSVPGYAGERFTDDYGNIQPSPSLATYYASGVGYTAYATPEDMLVIRGSATMIVRVMTMRLLIHTTAGALQGLFFIKRSTANTGGTATNPGPVLADSTDPAATAVLDLYTAAPTLGTGATLGLHRVVTTVPTAVPATFTLGNFLTNTPTQGPALFAKPIVLRGIAESLCMNWAGAALPAGFVASWDMFWTESPT